MPQRPAILICMLASLVCSLIFVQAQGTTGPVPVRRVALLPWTLRDGTETAQKTARDMVQTLFEKVNYEVVPPVRTKTIWEEQLGNAKVVDVVDSKGTYPELPSAKSLLALGRKMGVDLVCAGRASWHTKSVWVALGPKTKADCTVDVIIVDVAKEEVALDAKGVKSDNTRTEKGIETAASLFISMGFTALSGGPKTPHQQKSAQNAISLAMEPWLKTASQSGRKIGR
jgi:hypothetical protein